MQILLDHKIKPRLIEEKNIVIYVRSKVFLPVEPFTEGGGGGLADLLGREVQIPWVLEFGYILGIFYDDFHMDFFRKSFDNQPYYANLNGIEHFGTKQSPICLLDSPLQVWQICVFL